MLCLFIENIIDSFGDGLLLILGNIFLERGTQALLVEDLELIRCFEILSDQIFDVDLGKLFRIHGNVER